MIYVKV